MTGKIGFACKYHHEDQTIDKKQIGIIEQAMRPRSTTIAWLNRQTAKVADEKLWEILKHNMQSTLKLVEYVAGLEPKLRMLRLGSDILPAYTEPTWSWFWQQTDVKAYCQQKLAHIGEIARQSGVRLSMHPGAFCVLASATTAIVEKSIQEIEYHADLIRWMGYGNTFQDFKCNVHISGKKGPGGILEILPRLSTEARNSITIENDENGWGLDASLELEKHLALVVDIHHHWIRAEEYILPTDDRFKRVIDSWRGIQPVIHYSYSRDEHLPIGFKHDTMPNMTELLKSGYKKQKLRAHSDWYPNKLVNQYALSFLEYSDIMCESKMKNLASIQLYNEYTSGN